MFFITKVSQFLNLLVRIVAVCVELVVLSTLCQMIKVRLGLDICNTNLTNVGSCLSYVHMLKRDSAFMQMRSL